MKQFLLYVAAALMATSASAQKFSERGNSLPVNPNSVKSVQKSEKKQTEFAAMPLMGSIVPMTDKFAKQLPVSSMKGMTYTKNSAAKSIAKAAGVQSLYNATGTSISDGDVEWQMLSAEQDGKRLFADVIPNQWPTVVEQIVVEATVSGNTITIPAQYIGLGNKAAGWNVILFGGTKPDGSIEMTLGEDGSLALPSGEQIIYGAFAGEEFDPTLDTYMGYLDIVSNIQYAYPGQVITPITYIQPSGVYLHMGNAISGYQFTNHLAMIPANVAVGFNNLTSGKVTSYDWSVDRLLSDNNVSTIKGTDKNFAFTTEAGSTYGAVGLTAWNDEAKSTYTWGLQNADSIKFYASAGDVGASYVFSDGSTPIITTANPDFDIAYTKNFATPDIARYSMHKILMYQGKPEAPLYIEGVNMYVRQFTPKSDFNLTCQIVKVNRKANGNIEIGDMIAESSITVDNVVSGQYMSDLRFTDFYTYDEDGLTVGLDHLFIEDEFAIVISDWDNGTFSCYPYVEYQVPEMGNPYIYFEQTGEEGSLYSFTGLTSKMYVGFINASYGYLETDKPATFNFDQNGGKASVTVRPMLYSQENENAPKTTRLFLDDNSEIQEWFTVSFENENYDTDNKFDLVIEADPLVGGDARSAKIRLWQEGAYIDVIINQVSTDGIGTVVTSNGMTNGQTFNVAGQKVAADAKGIVIRDGKKFIGK